MHFILKKFNRHLQQEQQQKSVQQEQQHVQQQYVQQQDVQQQPDVQQQHVQQQQKKHDNWLFESVGSYFVGKKGQFSFHGCLLSVWPDLSKLEFNWVHLFEQNRKNAQIVSMSSQV